MAIPHANVGENEQDNEGRDSLNQTNFKKIWHNRTLTSWFSGRNSSENTNLPLIELKDADIPASEAYTKLIER